MNVRMSFPFFPILTLLFITLKLTNNIDWSWWLVLAPTLIPVAMVAVGSVGLLVCAAMASTKRKF